MTEQHAKRTPTPLPSFAIEKVTGKRSCHTRTRISMVLTHEEGNAYLAAKSLMAFVRILYASFGCKTKRRGRGKVTCKPFFGNSFSWSCCPIEGEKNGIHNLSPDKHRKRGGGKVLLPWHLRLLIIITNVMTWKNWQPSNGLLRELDMKNSLIYQSFFYIYLMLVLYKRYYVIL